MSILRFNNIGIHSVSACVPSKVVYNSDLKNFIAEDELNKTIHSIGIQERRIAEKEICSSDLCFKAAEQLIEEQNIIRDSIGALIFISQTPDYRQPSTAPSLQSRLGLSQSVMSFDINMACSGYIYGLSIAYSLALQEGIGRVLLLVGETMSKTVSNHDKVTTPLFGDAGSATLIERSTQYGDSCFSLHSDGSGSDILRIPYGGYRSPSCIESLEEVIDGDGNILTGEQLHMKGMDVFNFGLRVVPSGIKEILKALDMKIEDIECTYNDVNFSAYVDGGWFEDYVFTILKDYEKQGRIYDLHSGMIMADVKTHRKMQEFDAIFTDGLNLFIIELKSGTNINAKDINKIKVITSNFGGKFAHPMFISLFDNQGIKNRAILDNVLYFYGKDFENQLKEHLDKILT